MCCWSVLSQDSCRYDAVALLFPNPHLVLMQFFSAVVGLLGAFQFWPLTIYWPVRMYLITQQPSSPCVKGGLVALSVVTGIASLVALAGSAYSLVDSLRSVSVGGNAT